MKLLQGQQVNDVARQMESQEEKGDETFPISANACINMSNGVAKQKRNETF